MVSKMAKDGVLRSTDPSMASFKAVAELKKELQRLVKAIVDDDVAEDEALRVLSSLNDLKFKKSSAFKLDDDINLSVPEEFKCPISRELMRDPVILATGLTYDRPFIERWLNEEGHQTCPQTQQVLSHTVLTPNHLVQEMISQWCSDHGLDLPRSSSSSSSSSSEISIDGGDYLDSLLDKISSPSSSISDKKSSAKALRTLTKRNPSFRGLFAESNESIERLIAPISPDRADADPDLQEDLITTLLNLSIHESNRRLVIANETAMAVLIESLKLGTQQTKSNASAALFALSDAASSRIAIGAAGAIRPLIALLDDPRTIRDSASALFSLCIAVENKRRAVDEGAVPAIMAKIEGRVMVSELLAILALLSVHQRAAEEMEERNGVALLLGVLRERSNYCEARDENCVAILYAMCYNDRVKLREIRAEEGRNGTISRLARDGTSRARRKASGLLERANRAALITHTA